MRKTLTVRLVPTPRTDLPCIACGGFRTDAAVVLQGSSEAEAEAGIHRGCLRHGGPSRRWGPKPGLIVPPEVS
jgi:hypothetical protein